MTEALRAPHAVAFSYRRSVSGAVALFLSGLAKGELWGSRDRRGSVTVPPVDWDPETGEATEEFVRVSDAGTVRSWTWVADPSPDDLADRPFALALIQPAGADTAMLHAVDVADPSEMRTGMAVRAEWRDERTGSILDLRAFVPATLAPERDHPDHPAHPAAALPEAPPDLAVVSEMRVDYTYEPGLTLSRFLRALGERRIQGGRCPACSGVYVPPRPYCPSCGGGSMDDVDLDDRGTIVSYTVVHVPFPGIQMDLPFVCAWIRLDSADVPFAHLIGEVAPDEVAVGQRVAAVWAPSEELGPTWESIRYFRPCSEGVEGSDAPPGRR